VKYSFISACEDYSVAKWAKFLGISRSGYYAWLSGKEAREARLSAYMEQVRSVFAASGGTYGPDRVAAGMRKQGHGASRAKVRGCMERQGLRSVHCRRRSRSLTDSRASRGAELPNLTRGLAITEPFQVLSSDITYIRTDEGFEYLCEVRDVKSGVILAHEAASRMKAELVERTIARLFSSWEIPVGTIFHSDRGSQYTSASVCGLLADRGLRQSFSHVGRPGDNAWSESLFANLKKEVVHWSHFRTREEAREKMFAYIDGFYNTRRIQKRLGYRSPMEWLQESSGINIPLAA
jgi:putative transposase